MRLRRLAAHSLLIVAPLLGVARPLLAQDTLGTRRVNVSDTTDKQKTLFTDRDLFLAAGFAGLTVAMFPLDKQVARQLQDPTNHTNEFLNKAAVEVERISSPGAYVIGAAFYLTGKVAHQPDLEDLGWHGSEAALIATGVTGLLKGILGRSRPLVSRDTMPSDFDLFSGFGHSDRQSFPSGHTTIAFAVASSVTSEMRRIKPGAVWIVAPVMYGGATLVGLSRMYHDRHWASDVALGAAIGTFSGLKVVRYSHMHPNNFIDRVMLSSTVLPDPRGGARLAVVLRDVGVGR